jgi:hypothetical protein
VFFGARQRLHWSFPDPSKREGDEEHAGEDYQRTVKLDLKCVLDCSNVTERD